jgi:hypothetical protein
MPISSSYEGKMYQVSNWIFFGMTGHEQQAHAPQNHQFKIRDERSGKGRAARTVALQRWITRIQW